MKSDYPLAADLAAFLALAFKTQPQLILGDFDTATAVAAGIAEFERLTDRVMLAKTPTARTYDPPSNRLSVLNLQADVVSIQSVTASGNTQVNLTDYRPLPQDAPARGQPYNRLQFALRYYEPLYTGLWNSISITGHWGYSKDGIPEDAWRAMLAAGALWLLPEIVTQVLGGMTSFTEASVTEQYGPKPFDTLEGRWSGILERTAKHYRRVAVGF